MDKRIAALVLLEEEEEDELELSILLSMREGIDELFKSRKKEGYFLLLIEKHLKMDDEKFRAFFRLNKDQFNFILDLVYVDLKKQSTNYVKTPIPPEEKLAVTLR